MPLASARTPRGVEMESGRLLANFDSGTDSMAAAHGEPIWPVRSWSDALAVSSVAKLFGIRLADSAPSDAVARVESNELVLSCAQDSCAQDSRAETGGNR